MGEFGWLDAAAHGTYIGGDVLERAREGPGAMEIDREKGGGGEDFEAACRDKVRERSRRGDRVGRQDELGKDELRGRRVWCGGTARAPHGMSSTTRALGRSTPATAVDVDRGVGDGEGETWCGRRVFWCGRGLRSCEWQGRARRTPLDGVLGGGGEEYV